MSGAVQARLSLSLTLDEGKLRAEMSSLAKVPAAERKAIARATNRALNGTRTDITADLRARTVLKAGTIRKGVFVKPASWSSVTQIGGSVRVDTKRLPLTDYKVRPLRKTAQKGRLPARYKAVSYTLSSSGRTFDNRPQDAARSKLFVASVGGKLGVFARPNREKEHYRHLLVETGPSIQAFYGNPSRQYAIIKKAEARFVKELSHQIQHLGGGGA